MRDYQHAAPGTLDIRSHCLSQFLEWFGLKATPQGLPGLTPETVERFFLSYVQKMGRSARRSMQSALRTFFRFCLHQGYIQQPLDRAVGINSHSKGAHIFRHGLATRMLQKGHSLKKVADVLGHRPPGNDLHLYQGGLQCSQTGGIGMAPGGQMMQIIEFHSWLSEQIGRFIELRRLSGTDYSSQARLLGYFDRFLVEQHRADHPLPGTS